MDYDRADVVFVACHTGSLLQATPLAAASLRAELPAGCSALILNLPPGFSSVAVGETVRRLQPKLISFSFYVWNRAALLELARTLKSSMEDCVFVCGGPEVSSTTSTWADAGIFDVVIRGNGEALFSRVTQQVLSGTFQPTATPLILVEEQQLMPGSAWLSGAIKPERGVLLETARGCPFCCAYCFDAGGSRTVTQVPHARLRRELELFVASGVEQVWVLDSSFNVPTDRGKDLLRLFIECAPDLHYHLEAKAEYIDAEMAELLQQLLCSVQVGLQSVHAEVLKNVGRSFNLARFEAGLLELHHGGVTYGIDLIYGLPGDTYAGLCASLDTALGFYPNHIELFPLALLPGTLLDQQRQMYSLKALPDPPYTVESSASMDKDDFQRAANLTAALNLFYNTGRAVAYFDLFCSACALSAVEFLQQLALWLEREQYIHPGSNAPDWGVEQAHQLQQEFVRQYFSSVQLEDLSPAALDLMRYHHLYSDMLLAQPLLRVQERSCSLKAGGGKVLWRLADEVGMGIFSYPVEHYHAGIIEDLVEFVYLEAQDPCGALFYHSEDAGMVCRSVPPEVVHLYQSCSEVEQLPDTFGALDAHATAYWLEDARVSGILFLSS
ncbi:MAG: B12-binding domain-containing radical SAM protein [Desulfuromonadaceae bacterium]|nr:B12-binding domain-containing radical SAM protein [Desulfuromonas sp.]MDY0184933.1 B12-binding domain-containing radical SAM protein [Desulfuromonadaceae bacterium]